MFKNTERKGAVMVLIIVSIVVVYFFPVFRSKDESGKEYYEDFFMDILIFAVVSFLITLFVFIGIGEKGVKWRYESQVDLVAWSGSGKYFKKDTSTTPANYIVLGKVDGKDEPMVVESDKLSIFLNSSDRKLVKYTAPKRGILFPIIFPWFDFDHVRYDAYIPTIE